MDKTPKHLAESKLNKEVPKRPWLDQQPFLSCYKQQPLKVEFKKEKNMANCVNSTTC